MSSFANRISQLVDYYARSKKTVFAEKINCSESSLRGYMKGTLPNADFCAQVVRNCERLSAKWFLTGEGEMIEAERPNADLLSVIERLMSDIRMKDDKILEQAQTIGRLNERLDFLSRDANGADYKTLAIS